MELETSLSKRWEQSRSGAWAGRGFHYQHLFSLLILVRQWAGLAPTGSLVPEGLEDCAVELADHDIFIQVKSKKEGVFTENKVNSVLSEVRNKIKLIKTIKPVFIAIVIEQPCSGCDVQGINHLFDYTENNIIVCSDPVTEAMAILSKNLGIADILIEGLISDIYKLVADTADRNASVSYKNRIRISTTEIEQRITERLEAEDPSVINSALLSKTLKPVDFSTPVYDAGFYQGMKAKAGHVVSGQILRRDNEMKDIASKLEHHRHLLITGQSGAGKSSLTWLVAESLSVNYRWFEINQSSDIKSSSEIMSFISSRCPQESSPIALVFDDVGSLNSALWNQLVIELRGSSNVYLLGSIRFEDVNIITNQSDTKLVPTSLNEDIAKNIWEQLRKRNETTWEHWREPLEKSKSLMLEYIHILTQGERLAALIKEQIQQREKEKRVDELAILRATSVFNSHGGELEVKKLFIILEVTQADASKALKRLLNEHLVTEARSGILGGLHGIRSKALADASHDEVVYQINESLYRYITAVTTESLPHVIRSIYDQSTNDKERAKFSKVLSEILSKNNDLKLWIAILTGLGLATLEKETNKLISVLNKDNIQPSLWSLASLFAVANTKIPEIADKPRYEELRNAILRYRGLPTYDFRVECLDFVSKDASLPEISDLEQANSLLSCFIPIGGGESVDISFSPNLSIKGQPDIQEVATLLSTAYYISPKLSEDFVSELGGEEKLFSWMFSQTPWLTKPVIEKGEHGRTVRSNWFSLSNDVEKDLNQKTVDICETLIALSPRSDAAASDALDPSENKLGINDFYPYSKNMPRENIPGKAQIAWNVAFRQIILSHVGNDNLTGYVQQMTSFVKETEKLFRFYTEKWIRNLTIKDTGAFADKVNALNLRINNLAYIESSVPSSTMYKPADSSGEDDRLGGCLSGVLTNLLHRINISTGNENKAIAVYASDLSSRLKEQLESPIWRTSLKPPTKEITELMQRVDDISNIFHEFAFNPIIVNSVINVAKKGGLGKAVHAAGNFCQNKADARLNKKLRKVESLIQNKDYEAKCWLRTDDKEDSPFWPPKEIAILVNISDFEKDIEYFDASFEIAQNIIKRNWNYCIVPVVNDRVIPELALTPPTELTPTPLPVSNFRKKWQDSINKPFFEAKLTSSFDQAMGACNNLSAIITCRDIDNLHVEENDSVEDSISSYNINKETLEALFDERGTEIVGQALVYLEDTWDRFLDELELAKKGEKSATPLCMEAYQAISGEMNDSVNELAAIKILLIQEESSFS